MIRRGDKGEEGRDDEICLLSELSLHFLVALKKTEHRS
jgi:hypothetical protein